MNSKKFFLPAALLVVWCGVHVTEAAAAPKPVSSCQTISASGSYLVTKNLKKLLLTNTDPGDCIVIAADNITLNLGGYTISGSNAGSGITNRDVARHNITIRDGFVKGFVFGVDLFPGRLGSSSRITVEEMHVTGNRAAGIRVGPHTLIKHNIASENGTGIVVVGGAATIEGNIAFENGGDGITSGQGSTVTGNVVYGNGGDGISAGEGSTVSNNSATSNSSAGIRVACPSNVVGNTAVLNGTNNFFDGSGCGNNHNVAP